MIPLSLSSGGETLRAGAGGFLAAGFGGAGGVTGLGAGGTRRAVGTERTGLGRGASIRSARARIILDNEPRRRAPAGRGLGLAGAGRSRGGGPASAEAVRSGLCAWGWGRASRGACCWALDSCTAAGWRAGADVPGEADAICGVVSSVPPAHSATTARAAATVAKPAPISREVLRRLERERGWGLWRSASSGGGCSAPSGWGWGEIEEPVGGPGGGSRRAWEWAPRGERAGSSSVSRTSPRRRVP